MSNTLPGCVASLQSSLNLLSSSINTLDAGVNDFPRMTKVLQTTRHYELLPESTLTSAQTSLLSTLTPEVEGMLSRVEAYLDKLQRREAGLIAKYELQAGRLASRRRDADIQQPATEEAVTSTGGPSSSTARASVLATAAGQGVGEIGAAGGVEAGKEALRLKQIRQKKERLSYAVDRLALQAQQKERQLRQSVAKGPD